MNESVEITHVNGWHMRGSYMDDVQEKEKAHRLGIVSRTCLWLGKRFRSPRKGSDSHLGEIVGLLV